MRPKSRGFIKLKSNLPQDKVIIQPKLLEEKEDLEDLCEAVKLTIEIMNAKALTPHRKKSLNIDESITNDRSRLEEWVKNHVESAYHCSGTCAMGSVTEADGRVKGLNNLRICDASIMPFVTSGNTNAPTIMLAEKISDLIKGNSLNPSDAQYYIHPDWETKQR